MTYAYLTDGLDLERREEFDRILEQGGNDQKSQAKRERAAIESLLSLPGAK